MEKVRIGLIGVGMIGRKHADVLNQLDRLGEGTLAAICDVDENHKKTAQELGTKYYANYKQMLKKEKLDGVVVALPNELHVSVGVTCLQHGLHLFMEKPIAPTLSGADRLIETAKKNNVEILVGHHRRFNSSVEASRKIIRGGEIGQLVGVSVLWAAYKPRDYFEGVFSWRREKGGGPILINMIHEIDDLRYMCGEIQRVFAECSNQTRKFPVEDTVSVSLRFENGALGSILLTDCVPSPWSYEGTTPDNPFFFHTEEDFCRFLGTEASLTFPHLKKIYYPDPAKMGWQHPLKVENIEVPVSDTYLEQMRHFLKVVAKQETPRTSGEDGRKTLQVTLAILKSGKTGKPVSIL